MRLVTADRSKSPGGREELTAGVSDMYVGASVPLTIAKDAIVDIGEGREWDSFDNGC